MERRRNGQIGLGLSRYLSLLFPYFQHHSTHTFPHQKNPQHISQIVVSLITHHHHRSSNAQSRRPRLLPLSQFTYARLVQLAQRIVKNKNIFRNHPDEQQQQQSLVCEALIEAQEKYKQKQDERPSACRDGDNGSISSNNNNSNLIHRRRALMNMVRVQDITLREIRPPPPPPQQQQQPDTDMNNDGIVGILRKLDDWLQNNADGGDEVKKKGAVDSHQPALGRPHRKLVRRVMSGLSKLIAKPRRKSNKK